MLTQVPGPPPGRSALALRTPGTKLMPQGVGVSGIVATCTQGIGSMLSIRTGGIGVSGSLPSSTRGDGPGPGPTRVKVKRGRTWKLDSKVPPFWCVLVTVI